MFKLREVKKHKIAGYMIRKDGNVVVFAKETTDRILSSFKSKIQHFEIEHDEIVLVNLNSPWAGKKGFVCSPPVGGFTCNHCASPDENISRVGEYGVLYSEDLSTTVPIKILDSRPFKPQNLLEKLVSFFKELFGGKEVYNSYDYAEVEKKIDVEGKKVGVIFAGTASGKYAVAYDLSLATNRADVESIEKYLDKTLYAHVVHIEQDFIGYATRAYKVVGTGAAYIYAYDYLYKFKPVYYLQAEPTEICDIRGRGCKTVRESARPGYSGSVLFVRD